jgi:hypothetical protein
MQDARQLGDPGHGRITYGGIAEGEDGQRYYVKYAGAFENTSDQSYARKVMRRWEMIDVQGDRPHQFVSPFLAGTAAHEVIPWKETEINVVVMDYADGISLQDRVRQIRELEKDRRKRTEAYRLRFDLIRQLFLGIRDYAEGENGTVYVHRDLKPENIRVKVWEDENHMTRQLLKILDFDFLLGPGQMPDRGGTAGYTHPDLYFGSGLDHTDPQKRLSWDLYSAGMLIYYIMEGKDHFTEEAFEEGGEDLFTLKGMQTDRIWPAFSGMVRDMIRMDQVRYQSIGGLLAEYEDFLRGLFGDYYAQGFALPQYLEHSPGQEEGGRRYHIFCQVQETDAEGKPAGIPFFRAFPVYDGTILRLTYGKGGNICTSRAPEKAREIGLLSYLSGDSARPVCFIPCSDAARAEEESGKLVRIIYEDRDLSGNSRGSLKLLISEL